MQLCSVEPSSRGGGRSSCATLWMVCGTQRAKASLLVKNPCPPPRVKAWRMLALGVIAAVALPPLPRLTRPRHCTWISCPR
mmetsp:Transcript_33349/g.66375  ORF Transcript_33349/g.66375 Transcript_33349/m.66375 type:complete len:81 (-) Transcript_33349:777-1019(-)